MENADAERDIYDELLTQAEIQGNVNKVNGEFDKTPTDMYLQFVTKHECFPWYSCEMLTLLPTVSNALSAAEQALLSGDEDKLYEALKAMGVQNLQPQNKGWYLKQLQADLENKKQVGSRCCAEKM